MQRDGLQDVLVEEKGRYMRPAECRSYMRRTLAKEFEGIVAGFVAAAKQGSCPHLKLATELLKPVRKGPLERRGRLPNIGSNWRKRSVKKRAADQTEWIESEHALDSSKGTVE
jgi:hypothetical protein